MTEYDSTTISDTQPRKNMTTMGKVDISDFMVIIRWVMNTFFQSHKLEWASSPHAALYMQKSNRKNLIWYYFCVHNTIAMSHTEQLYDIITYPLAKKGLYLPNGMGHFMTRHWCYDLSEHNLNTATSIPYDMCIIVYRIPLQTRLLKSFKGQMSIIIDAHTCTAALYSRL